MSDKGIIFASGRKPLFPSRDASAGGQEAPQDQGSPQDEASQAPPSAKAAVRLIGGVPLDWPDEAPSPAAAPVEPLSRQPESRPDPASLHAEDPSEEAPAWGVPTSRAASSGPAIWVHQSGGSWPGSEAHSAAPAPSEAFDGSAARVLEPDPVPAPVVSRPVEPEPAPRAEDSPAAAPSIFPVMPEPPEPAAWAAPSWTQESARLFQPEPSPEAASDAAPEPAPPGDRLSDWESFTKSQEPAPFKSWPAGLEGPEDAPAAVPEAMDTGGFTAASPQAAPSDPVDQTPASAPAAVWPAAEPDDSLILPEAPEPAPAASFQWPEPVRPLPELSRVLEDPDSGRWDGSSWEEEDDPDDWLGRYKGPREAPAPEPEPEPAKAEPPASEPILDPEPETYRWHAPDELVNQAPGEDPSQSPDDALSLDIEEAHAAPKAPEPPAAQAPEAAPAPAPAEAEATEPFVWPTPVTASEVPEPPASDPSVHGEEEEEDSAGHPTAFAGGAHRVPIPDFSLGGMEDTPDGGRWVGPESAGDFSMPSPREPKSEDFEASFDATLEAFFQSNRSYRWKKVGELLKELALVSDQDLAAALTEQHRRKRPLGRILVEMGLITDRLLLKVLAAQKDVLPWFFDKDLDTDLLEMLEPDFCRRAQVLMVDRKGDALVLAMRNPADMDSLDHVISVTGRHVEPALADETLLAEKIEEAYSRDSRSHKAHVDALVQEAIKFADIKTTSVVDESKSLQTLEQETRPVTGIVNKIIADGIQMRASDIHIEPTSTCLQVRYRMDGRLHMVSEIPKELCPMIAARVKIMAELDPVEWRVPQDGRIGIAIDKKPIDLRVSVLPTYYGGRITMRILDRSVGLKNLDSIGFNQVNRTLFETLIRRPYGLFMVTGPTGSGKTTSLYAALNAVKDEETNIITCEDPVEYNIDGISQSQVNTKIGLTFAAQLRSILRQDPDVILVGEIRDHETAETAIRASITGHLVLSTLHCNDAPSAVPRMLDMGVDPYLLSTAVIGVMGQRLLRRICPDCRTEYRISDDEKAILQRTFGVTGVDRLWKGHGCPNCGGTGFRGRFAVHEIMPVTAEVASAIAMRKNVENLAEIGRSYGYRTMQEDAMDRVTQGLTTLREAQRLLAFEDIPKVVETPAPAGPAGS